MRQFSTLDLCFRETCYGPPLALSFLTSQGVFGGQGEMLFQSLVVPGFLRLKMVCVGHTLGHVQACSLDSFSQRWILLLLGSKGGSKGEQSLDMPAGAHTVYVRHLGVQRSRVWEKEKGGYVLFFSTINEF